MLFPSYSRSRSEERLRQVVTAIGLGFALAGVGALGYRLIEHWSWSDSLYMVFITLSTVGFGEVHALSAAGRLWTILLVVGGVGSIGYIGARAFDFLMEGTLHGYRRHRRMTQRIRQLSGHYILCGYGRVGRQIVGEFLASGRPFVVIDREDRDEELAKNDIPHVLGNAEDEAVLVEAGIERAAGLVTAVDSDTENVFVTLTARVLNPQLKVIARASNADAARKLKLVGADRVVSPYVASGRRMAHLALRPYAVDFLDMLSDPLRELAVEMQELEVAPGTELAGRSLRDLDLRRRSGVIVVALREAENVQLNPDPDAMLDPGDRLVVLGTAEQCARLAALNES